MRPAPARLKLHPGPARTVGTAVEVLSTWIDVGRLRLGGGTALEARWHHRSSTDLDFFFSPGEATPSALFHKDFDDIRMDLHRMVRDGVIAKEGVLLNGRDHIQFRIGGTPVSFVRTPRFHNDPRDEVEHETGVILSGTRDILAKKMFNRLGINRLTTERDAYDFAVARTLAPDDLAYAWAIMSDDMKQEAVRAYRDLAEGGTRTDSHALTNPQHGHIAADLWLHVFKMLDSDLDYVPPFSQGEGDTGHRSGGHGR